MAKQMIDLMMKNEAPEEQFTRLGFEKKADLSIEDLDNTLKEDGKTLNLDSPLGVLIENESSKAILVKYLGDFLNSPMLDMAKGFSLRKLQTLAGDKLPIQLVEAIEKELNVL